MCDLSNIFYCLFFNSCFSSFPRFAIFLFSYFLSSFHLSFSNSQVLDELLKKLKVEHVVWCKDKEDMYYEVRSDSFANIFSRLSSRA